MGWGHRLSPPQLRPCSAGRILVDVPLDYFYGALSSLGNGVNMTVKDLETHAFPGLGKMAHAVLVPNPDAAPALDAAFDLGRLPDVDLHGLDPGCARRFTSSPDHLLRPMTTPQQSERDLSLNLSVSDAQYGSGSRRQGSFASSRGQPASALRPTATPHQSASDFRLDKSGSEGNYSTGPPVRRSTSSRTSTASAGSAPRSPLSPPAAPVYLSSLLGP